MSKKLFPFFWVVVILAVGATVIFLFKNNYFIKTNLMTYEDKDYSFSIQYPKEWFVKVVDNPNPDLGSNLFSPKRDVYITDASFQSSGQINCRMLISIYQNPKHLDLKQWNNDIVDEINNFKADQMGKFDQKTVETLKSVLEVKINNYPALKYAENNYYIASADNGYVISIDQSIVFSKCKDNFKKIVDSLKLK